MTPDQFDERLTAYALADPGLTPAERDAITLLLTTEPAARQAVAEIQTLAGVLTAGLAAEQPTTPAVPLTLAPKRSRRRWAIAAAAVAAMLLVGAGVLAVVPLTQAEREREVATRELDAIESVKAKDTTGIDIPKAGEPSANPDAIGSGNIDAGAAGVPGGPQPLRPTDHVIAPGSGIYGNGGGAAATLPGFGRGGDPGGIPGWGLNPGVPGATPPGAPGKADPFGPGTPAAGAPDPSGGVPGLKSADKV